MRASLDDRAAGGELPAGHAFIEDKLQRHAGYQRPREPRAERRPRDRRRDHIARADARRRHDQARSQGFERREDGEGVA